MLDNTKQSNVPLPIRIMSTLLIAVGISGAVVSFLVTGGALLMFSGYGLPYSVLLMVLITFIYSVILIIVGIGLRNLRRWALFALLGAILFELIQIAPSVFSGNFEMQNLIQPIIIGAITLFCWSKKSNFS